jgi:DNA-binding CsgD family transcriptional regulator
MAKQAIDLARERDAVWFVGAAEANYALTYVVTGDFPAAIAAADRSADAFQQFGDRDLVANAVITRALGLLQSGDYVGAQEAYQMILIQQSDRVEEPLFFQHVFHAMASIVSRTGKPDLAARLFGMASAEFDRGGHPIRKVLIDIFNGYQDETRKALGREEYDRIWSEGYAVAKSDAIAEMLALVSPPKPVDRALRPAPLNLLSNREFEVLQYLVAGKTDPEIANALFLSPRTVSQHVSNILSKLQVPSRTAAAALAARKFES